MNKVAEVEVVNEQVANLQAHAKTFWDAANVSANHFKGYAYLCGKALNEIKEIAPHGEFEDIKKRLFPAKSLDTLGRYMNFAEAVDYKNRTVRFLDDGQLLLLEETLPDKTQEKVFEAVEKSTGEKGMMETIKEWRKKIGREKKKAEPKQLTEEEIIAAEDKEALALFQSQYEATLALIEMAKVIKLRVPAKQRDLIIASNVKLNDQLRALAKNAAK